MDYKGICLEVCEIAREAGHYIAIERKQFSTERIEYKGAQNLVSYVDKTAEKMIVERLKRLLPESGFITEEETETAVSQHFTWIIDPLDGTTNFVHGLPPYCVSIGLMEGSEMVVGVVYEVTLDELFYAWKGSEAWLNGQKIHCSACEKLDNALVAVGFSYASNETMERHLAQIAFFQRSSNGVRRIGSSTADLVYVAAGRFDVFFQTRLSPWDVAAGALIAERAGAVVTDYEGGGDYVFGTGIVAVAPGLRDEFMETLGKL